MRCLIATTITFLLGACSTSFDSSNCNFIGTCRGADDVFYCNDELFYVVGDESAAVVFVGETLDEAQDYCCPDDLCEI